MLGRQVFLDHRSLSSINLDDISGRADHTLRLLEINNLIFCNPETEDALMQK